MISNGRIRFACTRGHSSEDPLKGGRRPACLELVLWGVPGLFVVRKPPGVSSFDVIRRARRELAERKIGHAGTLDPGASGVLVLGVGRGTKLLRLLADADKSYRATMRLGARTDTLDAAGRVLEERDASSVTERNVGETLAGFLGAIEQVPPMFSAIKRGGKPLYKLARRGIEVERKPRRVFVRRIELVDFVPGERPEATFELDCSKGTYVRSLVEDAGLALGCGAHLTGLVRTRVGPFRIDEAHELGALAV